MKYFLILLTLFSFLSAQQERSSRYNAPRSGSERPAQQSSEIREFNRQLEKRGLQVIDRGEKRKTVMPIENRKPLSSGQVNTGSDAAWELNIEGDIGQQYYRGAYSAEDTSGNVFMVANFIDPSQGMNFVTIKYDSLGTKLWENIYNGPISGDDEFLNIHVAADQSLLIIAQMQDTNFDVKYGLLKYSADGILDKVSFLEEEIFNNDWPEFKFGPGDFLYLTERGLNENKKNGWIIRKYNTDGKLAAGHFFEAGGYYGGIVTPKISFNYSGQLVCYLVDLNYEDYLYLLESDLTLVWKIVVDDMSWPDDLSIDHENNIYLALSLQEYGNPEFLRKISITSEILWDEFFENSYIYLIGINSESKIFVYSKYNNLNILNTDGEVIDVKPMPDLSYFGDFYVGDRGHFVFGAGYFNGSGELLWKLDDRYISLIPGKYGIYYSRLANLTKYNNSGDPLWEEEYSPPLAYSSYCTSSFSDKAGFTYMAYYTYVPGEENYYSLAKTNPDGILLWRKSLSFNTKEIIQVGDGEFRATTNSKDGVYVFFDSDGNILKTMGSFGDYFSHSWLKETTESKDHYFFAGDYSHYDDNENIYYSGFKLAITDKHGIVVDKIDKIYKNTNFWFWKTLADAAGNFYILADHYFWGEEYHYVEAGIHKWSPHKGLSYRKIDFDFPYCTSVNYGVDGWGNFTVTWLGGCKTTGEPAIRFSKISSDGTILWESGILLEDSRWRLPVTIPRENGQLLLFKEMGDEYNNLTGTMYYLINRDGSIALKKLISSENYVPYEYYSAHKVIDKDHLLLGIGDVSVKIALFDIESGTITTVKRETDSRGRTMYINSLTADNHGRILIAGHKTGPASRWGGVSTATIMRFDMYEADSLINISDDKIELWGNYPNPYNGQTLIRYTLPENGEVEIVIYNMLGQQIKRYKNYEEMGKKTFSFANDALASGQYFYTISQKGRRVTGKMIYVK